MDKLRKHLLNEPTHSYKKQLLKSPLHDHLFQEDLQELL